MRHTWIIGGTAGIGKATAELLAETDREIMTTGLQDADVREPREIEEAWNEFRANMGRDDDRSFDHPIEIVYSAGTNILDYVDQIENDDLLDVFDVNLFGFVRLCTMLRGKGVANVRMCVISSDAATRPMRASLAYCSSKAGLNMAVRVAARELAAFGWRVNAVAPGMTEGTQMTRYIDSAVPVIRSWTKEEALKYELDQAVIKRRANPFEIAQAVQFVLEGPDYLNGEIITVNGGR